MRLYWGTTGGGKTGAMTTHLLPVCLAGDRWVVGVYPHKHWGMRLVAELYARLGRAEFLRRVRVEDLDSMDRVIMRRFIRYSEDPDPWQRRREDEEGIAGLKDVLGRGRNIANWTERPVLNEGVTVGARVQQDLNRCREVFFPECNLPHVFSVRNPERAYRMGHLASEELKAKLAAYGEMSPHDERNVLGPMGRVLGDFLTSPLVHVRTTREPTWDRVRFFRPEKGKKAGIYIVLGGMDSPDALRMLVGAEFAEVMGYGKKTRIGEGVFAIDEAAAYRLFGEAESRALSTMRAFTGIDSLWHTIQSSDYPTEEIARNVFQNCDLYVFRQGDDEEAMRASKLLMGSLSRMKEHHRETITRQVHAGFEAVARSGLARATDAHSGKVLTHTYQEGTQLVSRYGERTEERVHYEPGSEQVLWQAQSLMTQENLTCWVRRHGEAPRLTRVDWFPDSWAFQGDPERGIPPLWETKFREAMALLKTLPEYEVPADLPVPVPEPRKKQKPAPKGPTATGRLRGRGTRRS